MKKTPENWKADQEVQNYKEWFDEKNSFADLVYCKKKHCDK